MEVAQKKLLGFEYFLFKLIGWYKSSVPVAPNCNSLTRIKILKLLFFASAIKTEDGCDMLDVFDNFYAMQHGPVESDIYNAMASNNLMLYKFSGIALILPNDVTDDSFVELGDDVKIQIDRALKALATENERILQLDPFKLVDISHQWNSWKRAYEVAVLMKKGSEKMNPESIRKDQQYFA